MKPERFSSGNADKAKAEAEAAEPSMKPERFSSGNSPLARGCVTGVCRVACESSSSQDESVAAMT